VIHKQCRDKTETLRSGKNFEAKRELLRPGFGQRSHFGEKRLASRAAPIAPIQEARLEGAFVTGPPDTRFPAHIAERLTLIGNCQLLGVVCRASQFQAQFAMREETNNDSFFATAGRTAKELGQGHKLSQRELRQFKLIPAFGLKIVHEFEEQRLGGFHEIRPASLKLK
jgi:hypothetical protein